jgi:hypothetical protein
MRKTLFVHLAIAPCVYPVYYNNLFDIEALSMIKWQFLAGRLLNPELPHRSPHIRVCEPLSLSTWRHWTDTTERLLSIIRCHDRWFERPWYNFVMVQAQSDLRCNYLCLLIWTSCRSLYHIAAADFLSTPSHFRLLAVKRTQSPRPTNCSSIESQQYQVVTVRDVEVPRLSEYLSYPRHRSLPVSLWCVYLS